MAGAKFDILFAGKLIGDADPREVRSELQQRFKLSEAATERLFSGHTHIVKRGVDTATASRYRMVFRDAKALVEIRPVDATSEPPSPTGSPEPTAESALEPFLASADSGFQERTGSGSHDLPPSPEAREYEPPEQTHIDGGQAIDLSNLSLVPGNDWTLEDCQPPLPPVRLPDISHLRLVTPEPDADTEKED